MNNQIKTYFILKSVFFFVFLILQFNLRKKICIILFSLISEYVSPYFLSTTYWKSTFCVQVYQLKSVLHKLTNLNSSSNIERFDIFRQIIVVHFCLI